MTDHIYHAIIGLPVSGKTTFLAALWHLLESKEIDTQLCLDYVEGDTEYLNRIADCWRTCTELPRTPLSAGEIDISILIHEPISGRKAKLGFQDLAGESFVEQVSARFCKKAYVDSFTGDGGVMLFLNANRPPDGISISDVTDTWHEEEVDTPIVEQEWKPSLVPHQVQLVELLQFLQQAPFLRKQRRLAVIVSAWDVVINLPDSPEEWLSLNQPLLYQFILTNSDSFDFRIYGISAQGGCIGNELERNEVVRNQLLDKIKPSERIMCVGHNAQPHDLTAPIHWLMAGS